ncbi:MAG: GTPase Era [Ruminiclostridium sp.]|nr:GTPase Era [Ruminiclostridium sp.]MBQ8841654.1 GTPase Era [Ruminiclostridium sp.]
MQKSVFVAVTGRPNAGKSSLTNLLVGEKVAIVSEKPQTTRTRINGVLTKGETQYVFIDTPGMHKAATKLSEQMVKTISNSISDVEVAILMVDATKKPSAIEEKLTADFKKCGTDVILLLNKVDLIKNKSDILKIIETYSSLYNFVEIIPISVKNRINTELILPIIEKYAVESPHFFDDDLPTDQPEKIWLAEIVREKILNSMYEEIPHGTAVQIESMEFSKTNKGEDIVDIGVVIICEKQSHKGMIIGKQGAMLKKIGRIAREEMEEYFEQKVNMKIWVKVKEDWRNSDTLITDFGLNAE